jgi:hypothetical protein
MKVDNQTFPAFLPPVMALSADVTVEFPPLLLRRHSGSSALCVTLPPSINREEGLHHEEAFGCFLGGSGADDEFSARG